MEGRVAKVQEGYRKQKLAPCAGAGGGGRGQKPSRGRDAGVGLCPGRRREAQSYLCPGLAL